MIKPTFSEERLLWDQGFEFVAGVDEVGRGAFAGPIVAAAVILPRNFENTEINDSKLLSPKKRLKLSQVIIEKALHYSIVEVGLDIINKEGIGKANQQAMTNSVSSIMHKVSGKKIHDTKYQIHNTFVLVDGFPIKSLPLSCQKHLIKGDQKSLSIAAASIIAKVYRDRLMEKLADNYPMFGFSQNKGYGTLEHRLAIKQYGLCDLHRTSFNLSPFLK